jgi:hypothetical protein
LTRDIRRERTFTIDDAQPIRPYSAGQSAGDPG